VPIDEVTQILADARDALDAIAAERLPNDASVQAVHSRLLKVAHTLSRQAEDPITIGIVGEFSVGKSMLLGTLLGRPALLPVEQRATTGNITALYLRPGDPGETTSVDGAATVEFLTKEKLMECVQFMRGKLAEQAHASRVPDVTAITNGYDPVNEGWEPLEAWCRQNLWMGGNGYGSLESRQIAAELLAVRDAHLSAPTILGQHATVGQSVVTAALDLRPSEILPDQFPARDLRPGLDLNSVGYDASALVKVFPLISRVSYRVKVDPKCWPLDSLRGPAGNSIVVLDFPGLGTGRSDTRDKFLSRDQLELVHTIVAVSSSDRSDTAVPRQFFTLLESYGLKPERVRDYIIAVGNAFDLVPPPSLPGDGPLTLEQLRAASQEFRSLWVATSNLTQRREDRIRAVSSLAAIAKYGYPTDGFSQEQQARVDKLSQNIADRQKEWGAIGRRLTEGEPDGPWGATLIAFGHDGGIASLRKLIESHVAEHGLVNKIENLQMRRADLVQALTQLEALLPAEQASDDQMVAARLRVDQLSDELRKQVAAVIESVNEFRDPMRLTHAGEGVIASARERCMDEVMSWREWENLVLRSRDGLITKSVPASQGRPNPFEKFKPTKRIDDTTEVFFDRFRSSFADAVRTARKSLEAAAAEWIAGRNDELAPLRAELTDPELRELLAAGGQRLAASGHGNADLTTPLQLLCDLGWASDILGSAMSEDVLTPEMIDISFPMACPRYLPWHEKIQEPEGDQEQQAGRHLSYLFHMRREIAAAMADRVAFALAQDIAGFHANLLFALQQGFELIPDPGRVRQMFPSAPAEPAEEDAATDAGQDDGTAPAAGSPVRSLLREWRARNARPGL
jgi:hypothetical protein